MNALFTLRATATTPLNIQCSYRFQSSRHSAPGSLLGRIVERAATLLADDINSCLRAHPRWLGDEKINLKPALIDRRTGIFEHNDDALYYLSNFIFQEVSTINYDLLDVTKLEALFSDRYLILRSIFSADDFEWAMSIIGDVSFAAVNEYMCHEGGHSIGFPVSKKHASGFFRLGGRLRWPLIYTEEYRADANSWSLASRTLNVTAAAGVAAFANR
jgi:hypothetical protein